MHTIQKYRARHKGQMQSNSGFESIGTILRRMRRLHETRITSIFDSELSLTLDSLLAHEEAYR